MPAPTAPAPGIGSYLRDQRKRAGLNQTELGQRLGVHQTVISDWERGEGLASLPRYTSKLVIAIDADAETVQRLWWDKMGGYLLSSAA